MTLDLPTLIETGLITIAVVTAILFKVFGRPARATVCPVNAGAALEHLADAIRENNVTLREIRDGIVALKSDQRAAGLEQGHLQKSVEALHERFDKVIDSMARPRSRASSEDSE